MYHREERDAARGGEDRVGLLRFDGHRLRTWAYWLRASRRSSSPPPLCLVLNLAYLSCAYLCGLGGKGVPTCLVHSPTFPLPLFKIVPS